MNYFKILSLLAFAAAMTACSSDQGDEPVNTGETQTHCINVSLCMANPSSRTTPNYDNGTGAESKIEKVVFAFYNAQGICVASSHWDNPVFSPNTNGSNIESSKTDEVQFELPVGAKMPASLMVFVNSIDENEVKTYTLAEIKDRTRSTFQSTSSGNPFTMNNSVYFDKDTGKKYVEVATSADAYYTWPKGTQASTPVSVYVERMAVKVTLNTTSYTNQTIILNEGTNKKNIKFKIENWGLTCTEKQMYLIKNFGSAYTTSFVVASFVSGSTNVFDGWNDFDNKRSYWANSCTYGMEKSKYPDVSDDLIQNPDDFIKTGTSYNKYSDDPSNTNYFPIRYLSYNQITSDVSTTNYCNENTIRNFTPSAATSVIIKGKYQYENGTDVGTFYVRDKEFYTHEELMLFFLNRNKSYIEYEGAQISEANKDKFIKAVEFVHPTKGLNSVGGSSVKNTEHLVTLNFKSTADLTKFKYVASNGDKVEITQENVAIVNQQMYQNASVAEAFIDGKAVFFWPIRHLGTTGGVGEYGVVRNHCYQVTLNSIKNLGTGVLDPNAPLIPHEDETNFGINATVNILAWRVINNSADL